MWAVEKRLDQFLKITPSLFSDKLFKIFQEAPITFPPTYKYVPGTEDFDDSTKQRVPS